MPTRTGAAFSPAAVLSAEDARTLRLASLLLAPYDRPGADTVGGVVTWLGAMQAQDLGSGMWSFGVRLPGATYADVTQALERREALRTWPMRGTVHFVPSRDAHWMLDLMGGPALAGAARRREHLGLAQTDADRACDVLGEALAAGGRLTRAQCLEALDKAGITGADNFGYHLLWYASQRGITCIAPSIGSEQTFVLLDDWVPDPVRLERDEALATVLTRYVRGRGPVLLTDFRGWAGLSAADAKRAVAAAGDAVTTVEVEGRPMLAAPEVLDTDRSGTLAASDGAVLALPGFDEFLLGYKDRSLVLDDAHKDAIIPGGNGVFRSTFVRDGRVVGTWKRGPSRTKVVVAPELFGKPTAALRRAVEASLAPYAAFHGLPLEVRWPS